MGEDFVFLLLVVLLGILALLGATFLTLGWIKLTLRELLLLLSDSRELLSLVALDRAMHFVELLETVDGDDALSIFGAVLGTAGGHLLLAAIVALRVGCLRVRVLSHGAALVLREDVRVARDLRCLALPVRLSLLELLESAVVQTSLATRFRVLRGYLFVETVAHALAQSIDSSVAARSVRLLVAHALVIVIRVVSLRVGRQLDSLALGRHVAEVAAGGAALANIGT